MYVFNFYKDEDEPELLDSQGRPIPSASERAQMHRSISCGAKMVFNTHTGLPMQSSPVSRKDHLFTNILMDNLGQCISHP